MSITNHRRWLETLNFTLRKKRGPLRENKGADQLYGYCAADLHPVLAYVKSWFSHDLKLSLKPQSSHKGLCVREFQTSSDKNKAVQPQKMASGLCSEK